MSAFAPLMGVERTCPFTPASDAIDPNGTWVLSAVWPRRKITLNPLFLRKGCRDFSGQTRCFHAKTSNDACDRRVDFHVWRKREQPNGGRTSRSQSSDRHMEDGVLD